MNDATGDERYRMAPGGYRLPANARLGPVRLQVGDLARSVSFYEQVLGLHVLGAAAGAPRPHPGAGSDVVLAAHDDDQPLVILHEHRGARPVPRRGQLGLFHFALLVPDRASLGRFVSHLAGIGVPAATGDHAVSEAIYLRDPDRLGIEVYADRPRETWRHEGGELFMTTERVNVTSLVAAGADAPWSGMPRGTVMGHVHLSVADLAEAEAFYHSAMGFDKTVWSYPGALFMSAGGYHHHLGTNVWAANAPRPALDDAQLLEWEIVVPGEEDTEAVAASLAERGYAVTVEDGVARGADAWGTRVRIGP